MPLSKEQIVSYLSDNFNVDACDVDETTSLFSTGILDSFSMVELVSFIEQKAKIKFGVLDLNLNNLDTIENILKFVEKKAG